MTLDYRLCCRPSVPGWGLQIHEVYYNQDGKLEAYSNYPVSPFGDTIDELYQDMYQIWKAIDREEEPLDLDRLDKKWEIERNKE